MGTWASHLVRWDSVAEGRVLHLILLFQISLNFNFKSSVFSTKDTNRALTLGTSTVHMVELS